MTFPICSTLRFPPHRCTCDWLEKHVEEMDAVLAAFHTPEAGGGR